MAFHAQAPLDVSNVSLSTYDAGKVRLGIALLRDPPFLSPMPFLHPLTVHPPSHPPSSTKSPTLSQHLPLPSPAHPTTLHHPQPLRTMSPPLPLQSVSIRFELDMAAELPAAAKIHVTWPQEFNLNGNLDIVMAESTSWTQLTTPPYHFSLFQLGEHRRP